MTWKRFPYFWPIVMVPGGFPSMIFGQKYGALMFSSMLACYWTNIWSAGYCRQCVTPRNTGSPYITVSSSNGNIFRVTGPLCGEFTGPGEFPTQRPVTRSFDVFFDLHLNKRLSKQPWGWWFERPSWSFWSQCNGKQLFCEQHWWKRILMKF